MRRIAAVAITSATLMGGLALAAPAEAATYKWTARHSFANESAGGNYSYWGGAHITISGHLTDSKINGWKPCLEFYISGVKGNYLYYQTDKVWLSREFKGTRSFKTWHATLKANATPLKVTTFKVAECKFNSKGTTSWGKWKTIFGK